MGNYETMIERVASILAGRQNATYQITQATMAVSGASQRGGLTEAESDYVEAFWSVVHELEGADDVKVGVLRRMTGHWTS